MDKDTKKKIISSIATLSLTFCVLVCSAISYAWFSSNRDVDTDGMKMQVDATPNLIIADDVTDIVKPDYLERLVVCGSDVTKLAPATHDSAYTSTNLKYVTNEDQVDIFTGYKKDGGNDLSYAAAENSDDGTKYYIEKEVYIASNKQALTDTDLVCFISGAQKDSVEITDGTLMSASVDFYLKDGDTLTFKGTSNVKDKSEVTLLEEGSIIPLNTESYITVVMRFYFDGALEKSAGQAYVNTATLDLSMLSVDIHFRANETET